MIKWIYQSDLEKVFNLEKEIKEKTKLLNTLQKNHLLNLKEGYKIQKGAFHASIKQTKRVCPPWQKLFVQYCGQEKADNVKNTYPPSISEKFAVYEVVTLNA